MHQHTFCCKSCGSWGDRKTSDKQKVLDTGASVTTAAAGETLEGFFGRARLTQKRHEFLTRLANNNAETEDEEQQVELLD